MTIAWAIALSIFYVMHLYEKKRVDYSLEHQKEAMTSVLLFIGAAVTKGVGFWALYAIADAIYSYRFFEVDMNTFTDYVFCFIVVDSAYYFFHRCAHKVNFMWASHSVHHSFNTMQFANSIRLGWGALIPGQIVFLSPLFLLGLKPDDVFMLMTINIFYQYWIHTEVIDKLPAWFEFVFNTPAHHRIHHSRDEKYINKNFGGTLIIFDRIFRTFSALEKGDQLSYGRKKQIYIYGPFKVVFFGWKEYFNSLKT